MKKSQEFHTATKNFQQETSQEIYHTQDAIASLRSSLESTESQNKQTLLLILETIKPSLSQDQLSPAAISELVEQVQQSASLTEILDLLPTDTLVKHKRNLMRAFRPFPEIRSEFRSYLNNVKVRKSDELNSSK